MKTLGIFSSRAAGMVATIAFLSTISSQPASAQAVGGFLRAGGGRSAVPAPAVNVPAPSNQPTRNVQTYPMRSGAISARPTGPSQVYNQPIYNQPNYGNQPVYGNAPGYGNGSNYGNGRGYSSSGNYGVPNYNNGGAQGYSNGADYGNGSVYRRQQSSGPVVNIPDASEASPDSRYRRQRPTPSTGVTNGYSSQSALGTGTRRSNAGDLWPARPVTSNHRYFPGGGSGRTDLRITTPQGIQIVPSRVYHNTYIYNNYNNRPTTIVNAPPLLGGYYYGNYCDTFSPAVTYPSIYSAYSGFPQYIFNAAPNVIVVGQPFYQPYVTGYLPFDAPNYSVTYNQNNYYVASEDRAREIEGGGAPARAALKNAYPADSYQAAFADIARAWTEGDVALLQKHVRDSDTRVSVFLNKKYSYSIASGDFVQITRDALDRLHTVSFDLTRLRKAKTGDVTAYGAHVYRTGDAAGTTYSRAAKDGDTVPFDQTGADPQAAGQDVASPYDKAGDPAVGTEKTVYVSYTLRHRDGQWYIIEVDSADHDLVPAQ